MEFFLSFFKFGKLLWLVCIWLIQKCSAWAIVPVLEQSHAHWLAYKQWQRRWRELTPGVHYQLDLRASTDDEPTASSWIRVRNAGVEELVELHLLVEASFGAMKWQEVVAICRLRPGEFVHHDLRQLPVSDLFVYHGEIYASYDTIQVSPLYLIRSDRREEFGSGALSMSPTHFDLLNGRFKKLGRNRYHVGAFMDACENARMRLRCRLLGRTYFGYGSNGSLLLHALQGRHWGALWKVALLCVFSARPFVEVWVWAAVRLRRQKLGEELDAAATKFVIGRGKGAYPIRIVALDGGSNDANG